MAKGVDSECSWVAVVPHWRFRSLTTLTGEGEGGWVMGVLSVFQLGADLLALAGGDEYDLFS